MQDQARGVAMVTGATRNIGSSIALGLAEDGFDVLLMARSADSASDATVRRIHGLGRRALAWSADVRDQDAVRAGVEQARKRLGPVSVLVNNAAVRPEQEFLEIDRESWDDVLGVVLQGAFVCSQAVLDHMVDQRWGRIVNITGVTGQTGAARRAHVVTAKAGLLGLTKALALEFAHAGVTVNAVSPALIDTVREHVPEHHRNRSTPVGRHGRPEEVAGAVRYLVGAQGAYMTGQSLNLNGGSHTGT